jgi:hypothetical protein
MRKRRHPRELPASDDAVAQQAGVLADQASRVSVRARDNPQAFGATA